MIKPFCLSERPHPPILLVVHHDKIAPIGVVPFYPRDTFPPNNALHLSPSAPWERAGLVCLGHWTHRREQRPPTKIPFFHYCCKSDGASLRLVVPLPVLALPPPPALSSTDDPDASPLQKRNAPAPPLQYSGHAQHPKPS